MSEPTRPVRLAMLTRDDNRCMMCGSHRNVEAGHRQATGMGGRLRRPSLVELVSQCSFCNESVEGSKQRWALRHGVKVRRWVKDPALVPVWYGLEGSWFVLRLDGLRVPTTMAAAARMMTAVYGPDWEKTL